MKKILMLLYGWPPVGGVGSLRSLKFVKYLSRSGNWDITVLTAKDPIGKLYCDQEEGNIPGVKIVRTNHIDVVSELIKGSISNFIRQHILMPDEGIGWYKYAFDESIRLLKNAPYDLIYSCSPPETAHVVAHRLKNKTGLPWVADLRDLWSQDHYREYRFFKKFILAIIEKRTFSNADAIITVSEPWQEMLRALHRRKKDSIFCITNGFDPEDFEGLSYKDEKKFILSYTGKLHPVHQDPIMFFMALFELLKEAKIDRTTIEVRFYIHGFKTPDIQGLSKKYHLEDVVKSLPKVEYRRALELMRNSTVLLLFSWKGYGGNGHYTQKVFDYLGAKKPILVMNSDGGVVEELIESTKSGFIARTKDEIKKVLINLYEEFKTLGRVRYEGVEAEIEKYSRVNTTKQLLKILSNYVR